MASKSQKKRGYPLPTPVDGYPLKCVQILIPDAPEYRRAFVGAIWELTNYWNWDRSGPKLEKPAFRASKYWRSILEPQLAETGFFGGCDDCPDCPAGCTVIPLNDSRIEWLPNDPFRTPDYRPGEYIAPPWYIAPALNLPGFSQGDIGTDISRLPIVPNFNPPSGFPRFRLTVQGAGIVKIQFVNVFLGGIALVQTDADLLQLRYVDLNRDSAGVPPETESQNGIEINLVTDATHIIDVQMLPILDDAVTPIRFGGGVRKIELCGFDNPCAECPECPDCEECPPDCEECSDCEGCDDEPCSDCEGCE